MMVPMRAQLTIAALAASATVAGCVALGWRFGPGASCMNKDLFAAPPFVVQRDHQFFLAWTQGTTPFFFQPDCRPKQGRLVFAVGATSSSGTLAGRPREMKIEGEENIAALTHGGAFWWEPDPPPDGTLLPLNIISSP